MKIIKSLILKLKARHLCHRMSKILIIEKLSCKLDPRIKVKGERNDICDDFWYEGLRKLGYVPFDPQRLEDDKKFMNDLEDYINSANYLTDGFEFGNEILQAFDRCIRMYRRYR